MDPPQNTPVPRVRTGTPAPANDFIAAIRQFQQLDCIFKIKLVIAIHT